MAVLDDAAVARALLPRTSVVTEREESPGVFVSTDGPTSSYRRVVTVGDAEADGRRRVTQRVDIQPAIPYWGWFFGPPLVNHLAKIGGPDDKVPMWFPPDHMDERATATLSRLGVMAFVLGYGATLLTQSITFIAGEFGADKGAQGLALASVRVDILLALPLTLWADRHGRRRLLVGGTIAACVLTALGALAPSLWLLTGAQVLARAVINASIITIAVMVAEEMPSGARAWSTSLMSVAGFFGGGICVMLLPVADLSDRSWRILFVVPLLLLPLAVRAARGLTETQRFVAHVENRTERVRPLEVLRTHRRRFLLLAASASLLSVFATPASQFLNEFLRTERGFSGAQITLFLTVTSIPGGIGIVVGGWLAEKGRRLVGATATFVGVGATVMMFISSGAGLYAWSTLASIIGAAAVPALGVYGAELFPTEARSAANGGISFASRIGSVVGLVFAGELGDRIGLPRAFAYLAIGPLILTVLILVAYPETAHRELEDLNPEDTALPPTG